MGKLELNRLEISAFDYSHPWSSRRNPNKYTYTFESDEYLEYIRRSYDNEHKKRVIDDITNELIQTLIHFLEYDPKTKKNTEKVEEVETPEKGNYDNAFDTNEEEIHHEEIIL